MSDLIQPRTLRGFRDYPPQIMLPREALMDTARRVYRSYGFNPIDTPALEYAEILCGKGSEETDKQMYRFRDHGDRDVGLRFDLTVPLARFAAQHVGALGTPFKRYHIAPVWRGENTQRGRYREFVQCDFDTIGTNSLASDAEILMVIRDLFDNLGVPESTLRINHRGVLTGALERLGLAEQSVGVLRTLDKLGKIGPDKVTHELQQSAGASADQANQIVTLVTSRGSNQQVLAALEAATAGTEAGTLGVSVLREVTDLVMQAGLEPQRLQIDPSIARGLDYYTGLVVETYLDALPAIGSVCSGGRYDDLAGLYTKQALPGIGASLGLDRLLAAMEELKLLPVESTAASVLMVYFERDRLADYLKLATQLRQAGLRVELFPEPRKIGQQLKYADRRGFRCCLIMGSNEFDAGSCGVKNLATGQTQEVDVRAGVSDLVEAIRGVLAG